MTKTSGPIIRMATDSDLPAINALRHDVYARELGQYAANALGSLPEATNLYNRYLLLCRDTELVGFISITLPRSPHFSVDKYFSRNQLPLVFDDGLFEIRVLTVASGHRSSGAALALLYGAFRFVQASGGTKVVALCREELLDFYNKAGLQLSGHITEAGRVCYHLATASIEELQQRASRWTTYLQTHVRWQLPFPVVAPAPCFHGGHFFEAIGEDLDKPERAQSIINADVLDAWFPPAPAVMQTLSEHLPWMLQTSPPTHAAGLVRAISSARGIAAGNILTGAGSSDLIFRALRQWLHPGSRVLLPDPAYGEYAHVLEKVIGCQLTRLPLLRENDFELDPQSLKLALSGNYDLVVLVNPNSPTGTHLGKAALQKVLQEAPGQTRFWIDETYIDFVGKSESLESFAAASENVFVCKSLSKVLALSGARVAYLCGPSFLLEELRSITPPWCVSLPAQAAAIAALQASAYYEERYRETHRLRSELASGLKNIGISTLLPGVANFILFWLPPQFDCQQLLRWCRAEGLYLRDVSNMGSDLSAAVRIAVKDEATNKRMLHIIGEALSNCLTQQPVSRETQLESI